MPVINFTITKQLEKKITSVIKEQGFNSKAEFFRMMTINYIKDTEDISEAELKKSVDLLKKIVIKKYRNKKMQSLEDQMKNF